MQWIILGILALLGLAVVSAGVLMMLGTLDEINRNNTKEAKK